MTSNVDLRPHDLWRVLIDSLERLPDASLVEREDWVQLRTPSSRRSWHNVVLRAQMDPAEAPGRIAEILADHAARGAGFRWIVDADSTPADLSQRLIAAQIGRSARAIGMVRDMTNDSAPPLPAGVILRPATLEDAALVGEVAARGWQKPASFGVGIRERVQQGWHDPNFLHWIAYLDGEPVGMCTLKVLPGLGYLQGATVVPQARRRGIYAAMSWVRLEALRHRGVPRAVIWADESTSAPVARALGFRDVTAADFHEGPTPDG